jgi:hypothetical protein
VQILVPGLIIGSKPMNDLDYAIWETERLLYPSATIRQQKSIM